MAPPIGKKEEEIIVTPKNLIVLLHVIRNTGELRCIEQVGGALLSKVVAEHSATKGDVVRQEGNLIDPLGTDIYKVTKEYLESIPGLLEIKVENIGEIDDTDIVSLVILS